MMQAGVLVARKVAGRWLIDSNDLPLSAGQREAVVRKERQLRSAVEEGLGLPDPERQARYSVRDLKAFQIGVPLYRQACEKFGKDHPSVNALKNLLERLAVGCHRFERQQKAEAYRQARDCASLAVFELVLTETPDADRMIRALEQDLMAAMAGLLRRIDRGRS